MTEYNGTIRCQDCDVRLSPVEAMKAKYCRKCFQTRRINLLMKGRGR